MSDKQILVVGEGFGWSSPRMRQLQADATVERSLNLPAGHLERKRKRGLMLARLKRIGIAAVAVATLVKVWL